jgi:hypothetical protein
MWATHLPNMEPGCYKICNDPSKSASYICAIYPKRLVNLELS